MRLSSKQKALLDYVTTHPGCTAADLTRFEHRGRGHRASYDRVARLVRRKLLRREREGNKQRLFILLPIGGMK